MYYIYTLNNIMQIDILLYMHKVYTRRHCSILVFCIYINIDKNVYLMNKHSKKNNDGIIIIIIYLININVLKTIIIV